MRAITVSLGLVGMLLVAATGTARAGDGTTQGLPPGSSTSTGTAPAPVCKDLDVNVQFPTGSDKLDAKSQSALDDVSSWMSTTPDRTLKVVVSTDTTGAEGANEALSERRAAAVKDYLVSRGVDPQRITTAGHGEAQTANVAASGRPVTFLGCTPETAVAEETPAPAEPMAQQPVEPVPSATPYEAAPGMTRYGSAFGFALLVGGGYEDFTSSNARSVTNGGGSWDARVVFGARFFIGAEAAYVGTANSIQALGGTSSTLVSNGVEGVLRLNLPIFYGASMIEPFAIGGLGWAHYNVSNNNAVLTSDFSTTSDNVMTIPVGAGIAWAYKAFMLDVRGTWTATTFNNLLLTSNGSSNNLDHWGARGNLGVVF